MTATPYLLPDDLRSVRGLADAGAYPDDLLASYIAEFEGIAEDYCGVAFTPRTATETFWIGQWSRLWCVSLAWPKVRSVTSVTLDGDIVDADDYARITLGLSFGSGLMGAEAVVVYEHGFDPPSIGWVGSAGLLNACKQYVRSCAKRDESAVSRDAVSVLDGSGGSIRYSTPNRAERRPTGYLDVDRLLNSLPNYTIPGVG